MNGKRQTIASIATWVLLLGLVLGAVPPPAVTAAVPATERERAKSSDAAPPTTTIEGKPAARSNAAKAEFTYSSSTPDAIFECALDGGRFLPFKAGGETYAGLSQGRHTFKVRAVDGGTVDPTPDSHTWTVDTTAPKVSRVTPAPRARGIDASTNVTAVFAEGMDPASLTATTFTLNPEGENTPIAAAVTYDAKSKKAVLDPDAALDEGTTYRATIAGKADGATDLAGNPLAASKVWSFTTGAPKDTTPPQTTISAHPAARTDTTEATFAYASSEANARFACALDGGRFAPCPAEGESYRGLRPGKHSFKVRAVDAAGNADPTPASHAWTIEAGKPASERTADAPDRPEDTPAEQPSDGSGGAPGDEDADSPQQDETPPETTIERQPGKRTANAETDFAYASSEEGSSFECKLDGERFQPCAADGHTYRAVRDGKHAFAVRAVDAAGNTDPTPATYAWTLDTVPDQPDDDPNDPGAAPEEPLDDTPEEPRQGEDQGEPVPFTDGFEDGDLSHWTESEGLRVQTDEVAAGRYAARGGGDPALATTSLNPAQADIYYRVKFQLIDRGRTPVTLLAVRTAAGKPLVTLQVTADGRLGVRNAAAKSNATGDVQVTLGDWHEVELHVRTGRGGEVEVWYDGEPIDALGRPQALGAQPIGQVSLGDGARKHVF
ncbi:MAG: Ig-like domain-containing protein, partial [Chloroflexia bacterium]|nr:Ig-like domain-containing protein [Chloroflexia bacterium]